MTRSTVSIRRPSSRHRVPPARPPRRPAAPFRLVALLLLLALPAAAGAAVPVSLYLPNTDTLTRDEAADVEAVLISGLHQAARGGTLAVREPPLLPPTCGRNPTDACLAGLAGGGAVLVARARRDGIHVVVSMALVNGQGRRTRWGTFLTTLSVQDARPAAQALYLLEDELSRLAAAPKGAPRAAPAGPPATPPAAAGAAAVAVAPAPPPPSLAVEKSYPPPPPAPARPPPPEPAGGWSTGRTAGAWIAAGGVAVLAAGAYAGLQARSLDASLTDKFTAGTLTPADQPAYAEVRRWNGAANGLFIAGGVLTAGGAALFFLSPTVEPLAGGGLSVGLAGRF